MFLRVASNMPVWSLTSLLVINFFQNVTAWNLEEPPAGKPEGSFWWKSLLKLIPLYKEVAQCTTGSGQTVWFWSDKWSGQPLDEQYPELHSFAIKNNSTVAELASSQNLAEHFHRPLSLQAYNQFNLLQQSLQQINLTAATDRWHYIWNKTSYSSRQMYKHLMGTLDAHCLFKGLWKCASRIRHKNFFWLAMHDRVNTRGLLKRKTFQLDTYSCAMCNENCEESILHLFWDCTFAQQCWNSISPNRQRGISFFDEVLLINHTFPSKIAMDITILGCWNLWMQRNGKIFRKEVPSPRCWKFKLKQDLLLVRHRTKAKNLDLLDQWIASLIWAAIQHNFSMLEKAVIG